MKKAAMTAMVAMLLSTPTLAAIDASMLSTVGGSAAGGASAITAVVVATGGGAAGAAAVAVAIGSVTSLAVAAGAAFVALGVVALDAAVNDTANTTTTSVSTQG